MSARLSRILFSLFLAASLLFSQIGVGFLHDKHDAHERIDQAHKDQPQFHKHGEHCKICAIDLLSSLFIDDQVVTIDSLPEVVAGCTTHETLQNLPLRFFEGRAPPIQAI